MTIAVAYCLALMVAICLPQGSATCKWEPLDDELPLILRDYGQVGNRFYFWGITPKYGEALFYVDGLPYSNVRPWRRF